MFKARIQLGEFLNKQTTCTQTGMRTWQRDKSDCSWTTEPWAYKITRNSWSSHSEGQYIGWAILIPLITRRSLKAAETGNKTWTRFAMNLLSFRRWGNASEECLVTQGTKINLRGKKFQEQKFCTCLSTDQKTVNVTDRFQKRSAACVEIFSALTLHRLPRARMSNESSK